MCGPLKVAVTPSFWLKSYLWALNGLVLVALLVYQLPWYLLLPMLLLQLLYGYHCWRRHFSQQCLQALRHEHGRWQLCYAEGDVDVVLRAATVWPWLMAASYYQPLSGQSHAVLLLADSCQPDDFRRLSVLLKSRKAYQAGF
tara:strand:- start:54546 stop:54971 length:426 start_codon:yes stop_codon:yes gene_type:complete